MTKTKKRTAAYQNEIQIGGEIAAALPQFMTQPEVGRALGISRQAVARIERRALFKVRQRLNEAFRHAPNPLH